MTARIFPLLMAASLALAACDTAPPDTTLPDSAKPVPPEPRAETAPETCWQTLDAPASGRPAEQLPERPTAEAPKLTRFQTPCPADLPPDFVASLQRALSARALYNGAITGKMNAGTGAAVRRYQAPDGIDSPTLSLAAARRLGLIAIELPED